MMEINMKEILNAILEKEMEFYIIRKEINTKENLKII